MSGIPVEFTLPPRPEPTPVVDGIACTPLERDVFIAAFATAPGQTQHRAFSASDAVRAFRDCVSRGWIVLLTVFALALVGCTGVHAPADASSGDAVDPVRNGCLDLLNTWETYAPTDCARPSCPWAAPARDSEIRWCNEQLYAARGSCEAMQAAVEVCR